MLNNIPRLTKALLLLNTLFFVLKLTYTSLDLDLILGAFYPLSPNFNPTQILTHMFMHGNMGHFMFNMFALWMFGSVVENELGEKKFILLYFICGLGSFFLFNLVNHWTISQAADILLSNGVDLSVKDQFLALNPRIDLNEQINEQINDWWRTLPSDTNQKAFRAFFYGNTIPMVGASGAIFGLLTAFAVMFPNKKLMLLFLPFPIKAKYFVPGMILFELFMGINNSPGDNTAHFAHLGGALFGYLLVTHWMKSQYRWN